MDNLEKIDAYILNQLSKQESELFEKEMESNEKLRESVNTQKALIFALHERRNEEALEKIKGFKKKLNNKVSETDLIDKYIFNELDSESLENINQRIQTDKSFAEDVKIRKALIYSLHEKRSEEALEKIRGFKKKLDEKKVSTVAHGKTDDTTTPKPAAKRRLLNPKWLAAAAAIALLIFGGRFLFNNNQSQLTGQEYFANYRNHPQIIKQRDASIETYVNKLNIVAQQPGAAPLSNKQKIEITGLSEIIKRNYDKATSDLSDTKSLEYYKGVAYWEKHDYTNAKNQFSKAVNASEKNHSESDEYLYSRWYLALISLKEESIEEAKKNLTPLLDGKKDHITTQLANELLSKLK